MICLYDFDDQWGFDLTRERVHPPSAAGFNSVILDGRGDAPEQYPGWENSRTLNAAEGRGMHSGSCFGGPVALLHLTTRPIHCIIPTSD